MKKTIFILGALLAVPITGHAACSLTQAYCDDAYFGDCGATGNGGASCIRYMLNTTTCSCEHTGQTYYGCYDGYYGSSKYSTSPMNCSPCPAGSYSSMGATSCTQCGPGTYAAGSANMRCTDCPKGTYNPNSGGTSSSACTACPSSGGVAGTTSSTGATDITSCYVPGSAVPCSDTTGTCTYTDDKCYYKK